MGLMDVAGSVTGNTTESMRLFMENVKRDGKNRPCHLYLGRSKTPIFLTDKVPGRSMPKVHHKL